MGEPRTSEKESVRVKTSAFVTQGITIPKTGEKTVVSALFNRLTTTAFASLVALTSFSAFAQDDTMSQIRLAPPAADSAMPGAALDTAAMMPEPAPAAPDQTAAPAKETTVPKTARAGKVELVNIAATNKKIRANGWGEYVVGGRCLCCDNMKSIDCVTVQTRNRTDKLRIKQVVDGKVVRDTSDNSTFFGNVFERENVIKPVAVLMADITWPKLQDIYKVIVCTVADSLKPKNVPFNCELAYYDQFDRLRWLKKVENSGKAEQIVFDLEKPVLTKNILLKIRDGRCKLTEVGIYGKADGE